MLLKKTNRASLYLKDGLRKEASNNFTLETNPGLPEKQAKEGLFNYYRIMAEALNALGDQKVETSKGKRITFNRA